MEKYIKGKKYKLGDYFVIDNKVIKVVTGEACRDCAFIDSDECHTASCDGIIFKHVANIPKEEKIEPYIKGKYYEIGEKFSYKGSIAEVTEATNYLCRECIFKNECSDARCCIHLSRKDEKNIIFKPIEPQSDKPKNLNKTFLLAILLKLGADFAKTEVYSEKQNIGSAALDLFDKYIQEHYEDK